MTFKYLISTDLDGTLIDHDTYSYQAAVPALRRCEQLGVPVVLNTSKTYSETVALQRQLGVNAPIIVENGSALFFSAAGRTKNSESPDLLDGDNYKVFGVPRTDLLTFIEHIRASYNWRFEGFNDWSVQQIAEHTGLDLGAAERAKSKQFSEPFVWRDSAETLLQFRQLAKQSGLQVLKGGRFYHLQGQTDKAKPLSWLMENYKEVFTKSSSSSNRTPILVCLGDSHNDVAMLNIADIAVCVRSPVAEYPTLMSDNSKIYTKGCGPVGWAEAVFSVLEN
jgi:mannosyl-3-phosphoglycerate phosphatase family protein